MKVICSDLRPWLLILVTHFGVLALPISSDSQTLPQVYDLRNLGLISPVKDQGSCGACWAFATAASIESAWLKQGFTYGIISEDNLIDCHLFDESPCIGGSFYMSNALFSRHGGPVSQTDDPYTPAVTNCTNNLPFPPLPPALIEDMWFLPRDNQSVKQAIYDYGALATAMYFNPSNYNSTTYKYYDSQLDGIDSLYPHCVALAGWDDNITFAGAPGPGGWIIKDSYGAQWAQSGYFYVSYHDAGILSETVVFPHTFNYPASANQKHLYHYDTYGWVDNRGFGQNTGNALVAYTLSPDAGIISHQQIKRIGTYAVEDNTSIQIQLFRRFYGGQLSAPFFSQTISCPFKGYYTIPVETPTDTLFNTIYVKVSYTTPTGTLQPIPVEVYEAGHTSGIALSAGSCYISADGQTWTSCGQGTSNAFDLCVKMYTENAAMADFIVPQNLICTGQTLMFINSTPYQFDSVQWLVNGLYAGSSPNLSYTFSQAGQHQISLIAWLGANSDTCVKTVDAAPLPDTPVVSRVSDTLYSSQAYAYQWHENYQPIPIGTGQYFIPEHEGYYQVQVFNEAGCDAYSETFHFIIIDDDFAETPDFLLFPVPASGILYYRLPAGMQSADIIVMDVSARTMLQISATAPSGTINTGSLPPGIYSFVAKDKDSRIQRWFNIMK